METRTRAALLGVLAGLLHTVLRLFVVDSLAASPLASRSILVVQTLLVAVVSLAAIPGIPLYGAWRLDGDASSIFELAALVAAATGVAIVASYPVLTALSVGVPLSEVTRLVLLASYLVNAVGPSVHAGVGALAGFLLADRIP